jgi:DNA-binding transcriptional regulator YhcF (GntR family)
MKTTNLLVISDEAIASGSLAVGDQLLSVRQLAMPAQSRRAP